MAVGDEGESAVLDVEGEGVDIQSTGANHSDRAVVVDHAIRIDMYIRHRWGWVFSHSVRKQKIKSIVLYQRQRRGHHVTTGLRFDWSEK